MAVVAVAIVMLCVMAYWVAEGLSSTKYVDRDLVGRPPSGNADGAETPSAPASRFGFSSDCRDCDTPAVTYRGGDAWWIGVALGLAVGVASAIVGGGGEPLGSVVAVVLNPVVWFGVFSLFRIQRAVCCPHCQRSEPITDEFRNAPLGSVGRCPHCQNPIKKGSQQSQAMIG